MRSEQEFFYHTQPPADGEEQDIEQEVFERGTVSFNFLPVKGALGMTDVPSITFGRTKAYHEKYGDRDIVIFEWNERESQWDSVGAREPRMSALQATIENGSLLLKAPHMKNPLLLPKPHEQLHDLSVQGQIKLFDKELAVFRPDQFQAINAHANQWINEALLAKPEEQYIIARIKPETTWENSSLRHTYTIDQANQDEGTYHITSEASHALLPNMPQERARPNIILLGLSQPWIENNFMKIRIRDDKGNQVELICVKPSIRCTALNNENGKANIEKGKTTPLKEVSHLNFLEATTVEVFNAKTGEKEKKKLKGGPAFGMFAILSPESNEDVTISSGATFEVIKLFSHEAFSFSYKTTNTQSF